MGQHQRHTHKLGDELSRPCVGESVGQSRGGSRRSRPLSDSLCVFSLDLLAGFVLQDLAFAGFEVGLAADDMRTKHGRTELRCFVTVRSCYANCTPSTLEPAGFIII